MRDMRTKEAVALQRNIRMKRTVAAHGAARARTWEHQLRVFVTGGTGVIGSAVVREQIARGQGVVGLARSETAAARLAARGAAPMAGDISSPETWVARIPDVDAVVHLACDFESDMGAIEQHLLDALLPALGRQLSRIASESVRWPLVHSDDLAVFYALALDQRLSGAKARRDLGWRPKHLDPEAEIAALA